MTPTSLLRRTSFRIAALFAGLFSVAIILIFTALYYIISNDLNDYLEEHVDEVRGTLAAVAESGGMSALEQMVNRHTAVAQAEEDIYLLIDKDGRYVAGNIKTIPVFEGWKSISWNDLPLIGEWSVPRTSTAVVGRWTVVKDGRLFVADGNGDVRRAQTIVLDGMFLGLVMSAASALIGAILLGLSAQRRVGAVESALDAVAQGDLGARVPRSSTRDDLDHVAAVMNSTFDRLQTSIESLKQISTDIAHDLKTPIGRVRQRLELLQNSPGTTAAQYSAGVEETVNDLDGLIDTFEALLRIAEIEAGARRARFAQVDLVSVLSTVHDALEPVADDAGHTLSLAIETMGTQRVSGDKELLFQLFTNLVENAIRHCPSGSKIAIGLKFVGGTLAAIVRDNGHGIPREEREKVFRRLYRLEKSRTTPGSGLGLSLVAAIVELHDAKIELDDGNPGLVVKVIFPPAPS